MTLRFRGQPYPIAALRLEYDPEPGGSWWLFELNAQPEILFGEAHSLTPLPGRLRVDMRSLDEFLERLTGEMMTYYPPGDMDRPMGEIPDLELDVHATTSSQRVRLELDAELNWDFCLDGASSRPADYAPRRLELSVEVDVIRRPNPAAS